MRSTREAQCRTYLLNKSHLVRFHALMGDVEHALAGARKSITTSQVTLPFCRPQMMLAAVDFDDDVNLRVFKVHTRHKTSTIHDHALTNRKREAIAPNELNEPDLEGAVRRWRTGLPCSKDLLQDTRTSSATVADIVQPSSQTVQGRNSPAQGTFEGYLHSVPIYYRTEVNQRAMNGRDRNTHDKRDVSLRHLPRPMNDHVRSLTSDVDQGRNFHAVSRDIVETPEPARAAVGGPYHPMCPEAFRHQPLLR